jgi:hypothetical protein
VDTVPAPASAAEAMNMVRAGLEYLAAADATALTAEEQGRCLRGLEQVTSVLTAARSSVLGAFTAGQGYAADAMTLCKKRCGGCWRPIWCPSGPGSP